MSVEARSRDIVAGPLAALAIPKVMSSTRIAGTPVGTGLDALPFRRSEGATT
ncbi:MAG TPA: hypothetical protein VFU33_01790 [Gaiellaceae bacterium]|nr:hypothetical protein [Gaiellaceae bacterium]